MPGFSFGASARPTLPSEQQQPPLVVPSNPAANMWSMLGQALTGAGQHQGLDLPGLFAAIRNDPQGDRNRGYTPGFNNEQNPFSNGFFQSGASHMTPESVFAPQGRNATNQWAQLGQVPGVAPGKLQGLMGEIAPHPSGYGLPDSPVSDPHFADRMAKMFGHSPGLPALNAPMQTPRGLEGMINPNIPNPYEASNIWSAMGSAKRKPQPQPRR